MISLITTYRNRRHHLEKTMPTWIKSIPPTEYEIILVDYQSDDDVSDFLLSLSSPVKIVHIRCEGLGDFVLSHARNVGSRFVRGGWIFYNDIDTGLFEDSLTNLHSLTVNNRGCYFSAVDDRVLKDIINGGVMLVSKADNDAICGFNEKMRGWGFEDIDFRRRLTASGLKWVKIPSEWYYCIDHPDEERVQCYSTDKELSWQRNRQISLTTWHGTDFGQWPNMTVKEYHNGEVHAQDHSSRQRES